MSCGKPIYAAFPVECPYQKVIGGCKLRDCMHNVITFEEVIAENDIMVSILIPTYNTPHLYLCAAIESALSQTYKNIEIVIVDDGSTNNEMPIGTADKLLVSKHLNVKSERVIYHKLDGNYGAAYARNRAFELSSGDYICYLDSDDAYTVGHVESHLRIMFEEQADLVYSNFLYQQFDDSGHIINLSPFNYIDAGVVGHESALIKRSNIFNTCTIMHNRRLFIVAGGFEEGVVCGEDGLLWRRMIEAKAKLAFCSSYTVYYRKYPISIKEHQSSALKMPEKIPGIHLIGNGSNGQELDDQEKYLRRFEQLKKFYNKGKIKYEGV